MHSSIFKAMARAALKGKWQKTAWIIFVGTLISGGIQLDAGEIKPSFQLNLNELGLTNAESLGLLIIGACVCLLLALLIGAVVNVGMYNLGNKLLNGEEPRMKMLFPRKVLWRAVFMNLLRALIVFSVLIVALIASALVMPPSLYVVLAGIVAGYVVAIYFSYCYDMADYLLLEEPRMGPLKALRESRRRMKGFKSHLFWLELSFIGWSVLSMLPQLIIMSILVGISQQVAIVAGFASALVCGAFVTTYQTVAKTAFFREVSNPDDGYAKRRAAQQEAARQAYEDMQRQAQQTQAEPAAEPVQPSVDYDKAQDLFMEYNCSRAAMHEAGVLEEYDAIGVDSSMESRWMRDYADQLIRRFDRDSETLGDILRFAAEYANSEILDRALMRIDRHVRQGTLPAEEILGMAGRALALIKTGRFDENPGYADRKCEQIADIVNRLEERAGESDTIAKLRAML